jgi:hypothetical protein
MGRIFDNDTANFLQATISLAAARGACSIVVWHKPDAAQGAIMVGMYGGGDRFDAALDYTDASTNIIQCENSGGGIANTNQGAPWNSVVLNTWQCTVWVIESPTVSKLYVGGTELGGNSGAYVGMSTNLVDLYVGSYQGFAAPFSGKIAEVAVFARALSGAEATALLTADPSTLTTTGREFYCKMNDASLANLWTPVSGDSFGTLSVNGTVAWDTDSPYAAGGSPTFMQPFSRNLRRPGGFKVIP